MTHRASSVIPPFVPASDIREALGNALGRIRSEEKLTWEKLAERIGRGDDQTARYVDGTAEMGVATFYRCRQLWNGKFTGDADKLISDAAPPITPHKAQSCVTKLAFELSTALEDGEMSRAELLAMRTTLEDAKVAIDAQLAKLAPKKVQGL